MQNPTPTSKDALAYACPFCGAEPGAACRARSSGTEKDWPHSRRIRLAHRIPPPPTRRALCCECGELRTFMEARNRAGFGDHPDWHRQLGELKCSHCQRVTTHALLEVDGNYRDVDEYKQRAALGEPTIDKERRWSEESVEKFRRVYRQGNLPRNPYLRHLWWIADEESARETSQSQMTALCGDVMDVPPAHFDHGPSTSELLAPDEYRDQEYEDPATGLWWVDMGCVNCLRVANAEQLKWQRRRLMCDLMDLASHTEDMDAAQVAELLEHIKMVRR